MRRISPVRIAGMGCISAAGSNVAANIAALDKGERNAVAPSFLDVETACPVFRAEVPESAPEGLPDPFLYERCARTARMAACAATEALEDAGYDFRHLAGLRVGICLGTSVGTALNFSSFYLGQKAGRNEPLDPVDRYLASNPAPALARMLRTTGPVQTVANACASGADAIGYGAEWIRSGLCDIVLCGGADGLSRITYLGFGSLKLLSHTLCRPFDKHRAGLNLGEGAAVMVLEAAPRGRGRAPLGTVLGYGTATDAWHLTAPHPEARGLVLALGHATAQAGIRNEDIAFINAHGTATPTNDASESKFFRNIFPTTPFLGTKGVTGHTLGAAGALEAVFTVKHLERGRLPASVGFAEVDPELGIAPVTSPVDVAGSIAMSQSLAFGGNNSVLLFGKEA